MTDETPNKPQSVSAGTVLAIVVAGFLLWPQIEKVS